MGYTEHLLKPALDRETYERSQDHECGRLLATEGYNVI